MIDANERIRRVGPHERRLFRGREPDLAHRIGDKTIVL